MSSLGVGGKRWRRPREMHKQGCIPFFSIDNPASRTWGGNAGPANRGWVVGLGEGGEPALGEKWWRWRRTTMATAAAAVEDAVGRWCVVMDRR